ncbi:hypothetical protein G6F43_006574 [Rhizopus delemar]|nr:hypothetical protein G6F43_006574 [Rhizopus delemar]
MFSEFEVFRKRPIITYSRKTRLLPLQTEPKLEIFSPTSLPSSPTVQSSISSSSSNSDLIDEEQEEKQDDIFKFPEEESVIELMVASTRNTSLSPKPHKRSKQTKKPTRTKVQQFAKNKERTTAQASTVQVSIIKPSIVQSSESQPVAIQTSPVQTSTEHYDIFAFDPFPSRKKSINNNNNTTYSIGHSFISTFNNDKQRLQQPQHPIEKRKRNLVGQLKGASGEKENVLRKEFDFSDDEEPHNLPLKLPIEQVARERSKSPELSYEDRMEKELESIMQSEFGESKEQVHANERPKYQPLNEIKVRVTYTKRSK